MPFGLTNAPATFERLMEQVLVGLPWTTCLVYLDDIVVHAQSFQDELDRLREIFSRLRNANLKLNPKKCLLFPEEVSYLGHRITYNVIQTDSSKTEAVDKSQRLDEDLSVILSWIESNDGRPDWSVVAPCSRTIKILWVQWDSPRVHERCLYRLWEGNTAAESRYQLIVPKKLREDVKIAMNVFRRDHIES